MAYKKKSYKKNGRRRRGGYGFWRALATGGKYATNVAATAAAALQTANYVKDMINVEKKFVDTATSTSISTTGQVVHLSDVAQGAGQSARDGNSIKVTYLGLNIGLTINASATASLVRILVVRDNQQVGDTSPTMANVLAAEDTTAFLNGSTLGRFSILYDKVFTLNSTGVANRMVHIKLPMKHHVRYNGTASTDIQKGGLYYMAVSNEATNTVAHYMNARLRYIDN